MNEITDRISSDDVPEVLQPDGPLPTKTSRSIAIRSISARSTRRRTACSA